MLAHGFLRLLCGDCGHDKLVAFSCKRRGVCPSCGARRMAQTAAHLSQIDAPQPVGSVAAHPAATATGRATQSGGARAPGDAPRHYALPARSGRTEGRAG
ncbi:MAG: transposase zinc-binding domain-containing protein [Rubrivivax sp.]